MTDVQQIPETTRQWAVDREMIEGAAPTAESMILAANAEQQRPRYICASEYADAVHILRTKGFTWKEVTDWINANGACFSLQALIAGYRKKYSAGVP